MATPLDMQRLIRKAADAKVRELETAAEKAVQGGVCGVLVIRNPWSASPHVSIPYGQLYEFPHYAAFSAWQEAQRG